MMTRTATSTLAGRSTAMRRLRRRSTQSTAAGRTFCRTNGCASFLEVDPNTGIAACPICGYLARAH